MKSETHIRIKESRNKYFQEMRNRLTEKNEGIYHEKSTASDHKKENWRSISLRTSVSISELYNKQAVDRGLKVMQFYSGQVRTSLVARKNSMADSVNQRSEKVKNRLTSLMLVLFDA